jgi:hypothetical protein
MYLLHPGDDGELSLVEFEGSSIPPYAILSHTWMPYADKQVTFREILDCTWKHKESGRKIHFCLDRAKKDGLDYFWVDTCCIDKTNSAEVTEAINSMFSWYQNASRCYVYLADVSEHGFNKDSVIFRKSRWFTRAWTLQELLAPKSVEFFSKEGGKLGDKITLAHRLHDITGIPITALDGSSTLAQFSIADRFSWAAHRDATLKEDSAYSLLGIFDVQMPIIYGEGRDYAFMRLEDQISRQAKRKPTKEAISRRTISTAFFGDRPTFILILVLFTLLSGIALGICISQTREPACNPNRDKLSADDGFWALLSQLFLQILAVYCTLYPVASRERYIKVSKLWFAALLVISFTACLLALALYTTSWKVAAVFSFVSNLAAVTSLAQLAEGLSVKNEEQHEKTKNM